MGIIVAHRGQPIPVVSDVWVCTHCERYVACTEQMTQLHVKAAEKYKELFPENT
jgi:hypothetical protein